MKRKRGIALLVCFRFQMERWARGVLVALVTLWVQLAGGVIGPLPNNSQGLAIDFQSGAVYVSDPVHHSVVRYQSVYDLASGIAIGGGLLAQPIGLWIDQGTLYVADYLNETIKIWTNALSATNQTLPYAVIGGPGTKGTRLIPWALCVYNTSLFVADTGNGRYRQSSRRRSRPFSLTNNYRQRNKGPKI